MGNSLATGSPTGLLNQIFLYSGVGTLGIQMVGFIVAYLLQTEHFYDMLGAINALAVAVFSLLYGKRDENALDDPRKWWSTVLYSVSRIWLLLFLTWRAKDRSGDSRFEKIKPFFFKFMGAWFLQAVWVFTVAMPTIFTNGVDKKTEMDAGDYVCVAGFLIGLITEISSDIVKTRWIKAGRPGGFCTVGLWDYSRHPNYFGEILMWWCSWGLTVRCWNNSATPSAIKSLGVCSILSPLTTMGLLLFVSGIPLAEGKALKRYERFPEYPAYRESTSPLIPLPKFLYKNVPTFLKRLLFFELPMYEYRPSGKASAVVGGNASPPKTE